MKPLLLTAAMFLLILPALAGAQTYYIRDGAAGTSCSDWGSNACDSLPSTLQRGATYYIADGSYGAYTFDDAESGTQLITIKKATASDHGTATGWLSSYGDGVAEFTGLLSFKTGYWTFDGVTGGGPGSWDSGHGFRVNYSGSGVYLGYTSGGVTYVAPHITLKHINIGSDEFGWPGGGTGIYAPGARGPYLTVQYCYIHHRANAGILVGGGNLLYEYNYLLYPSLSTNEGDLCCTAAGVPYAECTGYNEPVCPEQHGTGFALHAPNNNTTIRYNLFAEAVGSGVLGVYKSGNYDGMRIYGNIFYNTDSGADYLAQWHSFASPMDTIYQTGVEATGPITNSKIYNNIFYKSGHGMVVDWDRSTNTGNEFKNNIVYASSKYYSTVGMTFDYNAADHTISGDSHLQTLTSSPMVDPENGDFTLSGPTTGGAILTNEIVNGLLHTYDKDMYGNTRGADGTWDRGAYEYTGSPSQTCSQLGGSCCSSGQTCSGSFQSSSNCASLCCIGGSCQIPAQTCPDGTPYSSCSSTKPLYCSAGTLINNCQACGCPTGQTCQSGGACQASQYFLPDQYVQAESGTLTGMQTNTSGTDTHIYTITDNSGSASYTFQIDNPGKHRMEARLLTQNIGQNSFYVGLDSQAANGNNSYAYDAMLSSTSSFEWDNVSLRGPNGLPELDEYDPMNWTLSVGLHTFTFYGREANTWLDQIILKRACHKSDSSCDGCVSGAELSAFIDLWKVDSSNPTLKELIEAIGLWKRGC